LLITAECIYVFHLSLTINTNNFQTGGRLCGPGAADLYVLWLNIDESSDF